VGHLKAFEHVTADGCFAGPRGEIDWFKSIPEDAEWSAYSHDLAEDGSTLVFGRTTYEMMRSYWPTSAAIQSDPRMAAVVNRSRKIVFSRTLRDAGESATWKNVEVLREIDGGAMRKRKADGDLTILGSGSIVQQLSNLGLIDESMLIVVPTVLGGGKRLFDGVRKTDFELVRSRTFPSGLVLLTYRPR
jgi:dihydrofolate reductase